MKRLLLISILVLALLPARGSAEETTYAALLTKTKDTLQGSVETVKSVLRQNGFRITYKFHKGTSFRTESNLGVDPFRNDPAYNNDQSFSKSSPYHEFWVSFRLHPKLRFDTYTSLKGQDIGDMNSATYTRDRTYLSINGYFTVSPKLELISGFSHSRYKYQPYFTAYTLNQFNDGYVSQIRSSENYTHTLKEIDVYVGFTYAP